MDTDHVVAEETSVILDTQQPQSLRLFSQFSPFSICISSCFFIIFCLDFLSFRVFYFTLKLTFLFTEEEDKYLYYVLVVDFFSIYGLI